MQPEFYLPRRTQSLTDWMVYWIDPKKKKGALAMYAKDPEFVAMLLDEAPLKAILRLATPTTLVMMIASRERTVIVSWW